MSKIRQKRTAEQIRLILSDLILRNARDPRLQGLTVTSVRIDRELQHADVYVNALGDEARELEVMESISRASSYFRRELAGRLKLRTVPNLHFHWDPSLAHAARIDELLESLDIPDSVDEDREV